MSATPEIAGTKPIRVAVEDGKSYWWCACGRSKKQPFCDGSHKGSEFSPMEYKAAAAGDSLAAAMITWNRLIWNSASASLVTATPPAGCAMDARAKRSTVRCSVPLGAT